MSGDYDDLTPAQNANIEYDVDTAMENALAIPELNRLCAKAITQTEKALSPALSGRHIQSCLHAVDAAYVPNVGHAVKGQGRDSELRAYLCLDHPGRLMCSKPQDRHGSGCLAGHLDREHPELMEPVHCYVCKVSLPADEATAVRGSIVLRDELPIYPSHDRTFTYRGVIRVLPWAWLCVRHSGAVDLPSRMEWRSRKSRG